MSLRIVQSKQNARLKQLRRVLAHPVRDADRQPGDWVGIEGPNLLIEARNAGVRVECVFAALGSEALLQELDLATDCEVLLLPRELLDSALTTGNPQPVAALVEPPLWSWNDLLVGNGKTAPLILILAGVQDPGNLGTILRSAEAFGASGALSLPGTVSAWNPKALRASAGSLFRLPFLAVEADVSFSRLRQAGVKIWTTAPKQAGAAHSADLAAPTALMIGNEGNGVPAEWIAEADGALTIPCPGPVESLNASVAASVLLYEASRQRAGRGRR